MRDDLLIDVRDLHITLDSDGEDIPVVEGIDFQLAAGKVLALVGESGCGKSVTSQSLLRLLPRELRITSGQINFRAAEGQTPVDLAAVAKDGKEIRTLRGTRIAMIFQEPMSSFSPLHTMGNQIGEVIRLHRKTSKAETRAPHRPTPTRKSKALSCTGFFVPQVPRLRRYRRLESQYGQSCF